MDDGDGCTKMWIYLMPGNCILKNCWDVKFCYVYFIATF